MCHCNQCGYDWKPRNGPNPVACPKCKRYDWNEAKKGNGNEMVKGGGGKKGMLPVPGTGQSAAKVKRPGKPVVRRKVEWPVEAVEPGPDEVLGRDAQTVDLCGFVAYNEQDGENYRCCLSRHGVKQKHGGWVKV